MVKPYYESNNGIIYNGNVIDVLSLLPEQSVNCCVTSPPYWGLRDYGVDGQLGLEKTPEEYVKNMVAVFREVKRVLMDDGTLWLNLGDTYAGYHGNKNHADNEAPSNKNGYIENMRKSTVTRKQVQQSKNPNASIPEYGPNRQSDIGLKAKDLVGIPWRVAFALQADGWYLRQDIIWAKPNPMPESVTDRCTKSHEYIFLLSKSSKYYYDHVAIKEPVSDATKERSKYKWTRTQNGGGSKESLSGYDYQNQDFGNMQVDLVGGRNRRSVWTVTTKPFSKAHFAVFPPKLIEPCILAGCPKGGTVLDPFFGSGTTGLVAYNFDRKFIGIDINSEYCEMSAGRIKKETSQLKLFTNNSWVNNGQTISTQTGNVKADGSKGLMEAASRFELDAT